MSATFSLTEDEYMAAQRLFCEKGLPAYVRVWRRVAIMIGVLLVVGGFSRLIVRGMHVAAMPRESWQVHLAWLAVILVGCSLISFFWLGFDLAASRAYGLERRSESTVTWSLFRDGLRLETPTARAEILWLNFRWYAESKQLVIIGVTKKHFHVFPKRAFTDNDLAEFRSLLKKYVREKK